MKHNLYTHASCKWVHLAVRRNKKSRTKLYENRQNLNKIGIFVCKTICGCNGGENQTCLVIFATFSVEHCILYAGHVLKLSNHNTITGDPKACINIHVIRDNGAKVRLSHTIITNITSNHDGSSSSSSKS